VYVFHLDVSEDLVDVGDGVFNVFVDVNLLLDVGLIVLGRILVLLVG
jgi:hypothetical protein